MKTWVDIIGASLTLTYEVYFDKSSFTTLDLVLGTVLKGSKVFWLVILICVLVFASAGVLMLLLLATFSLIELIDEEGPFFCLENVLKLLLPTLE